ncbi:hypothetical protein OA79_15580 [Marinomonas sp. TW1]|nr:hypothetical protein OA79_15580 [Marinomonas sp. TW1]
MFCIRYRYKKRFCGEYQHLNASGILIEKALQLLKHHNHRRFAHTAPDAQRVSAVLQHIECEAKSKSETINPLPNKK